MGKGRQSKQDDVQLDMFAVTTSNGALDIPVQTNYVYDPNRGRRTTAYTAKEMQRLSAAHRARLKRNRELAKASKERKKQRAHHLQHDTVYLETDNPRLRAELAAKRAVLQQARAQTAALLQSCSCSFCKSLQHQLEQLGN